MAHLTLREYDDCPMGGRNVAATPVSRFNGKPAYRVPVCIRENSSRLCTTVATRWVSVIARSAADAANWVLENEIGNRPETEVIGIGPKGGEVLRYNGWHSAIGREILGPHHTQLKLI